MGRTRREKSCDRCQQSASVMYRVRYTEGGEWQFVCDRCYPQINKNNPHYRYGGTWKAIKRH